MTQSSVLSYLVYFLNVFSPEIMCLLVEISNLVVELPFPVLAINSLQQENSWQKKPKKTYTAVIWE